MNRYYAVAYNSDLEQGIGFYVRADNDNEALDEAKNEAKANHKTKIFLENESGEEVFNGKVA